jgi:LysR family glycine cleavage system transcriptional activator
MLPSLKALYAFDHAARTGSFKSAAEALNVSPTAISHHIRTLEENLGVLLFHRDGRNVTLTPRGRDMAADVGIAFAQLIQAVDRARNTSNEHVIRIAAGPFFAARWLMPRLATFWEKHPKISLEVVPIPERLSGRDIDADISISWDDATEENAQPLLTLAPFAIASPELIERIGRPTHPADLLSAPLIHQRDTSSWAEWFEVMGVACGKSLNGPIFEDANAVMRGAVDGQGVTLGWMPLIEHEIETGRVMKLFDQPVPWKKQYYLNITSRGLHNPAAPSVVEWLHNEGAQNWHSRIYR